MVIDIQTVRMQDAPTQRRKSVHTLVGICILGAILWIPVALPEWTGWTTPLLVVVPGLLAISAIRFSILSAAYLMEIALFFGVTSLILGSHWQPRLVSAVLVWSLAIAAGTLLGGPSPSRLTSPVSRSWLEPRWPHYLLCGAMIGVGAYLALSGKSGYSAQITSRLSTPTGILGTISVVAPIVTLTILLSCIGSGRHSRWAIGLAGAQMFVLSLTGFRAAGGVFIIAIFLGAALILPHDSVWRRKSRLAIILPVLLILLISTFVIGANIKNSSANRLGVASVGTQLFTLDNALSNTSRRFQLATFLDSAIRYQNDAALKDAVSWGPQLEAVVPRFLWRDKPPVDYGSKISIALFGSAYALSSTPVSTIGDSLINFGSVGLVLTGLFVGFAFRWVANRVRSGSGVTSVLICALVSYYAMNQEQAILLLLVGILRNGLVAAGLLAAATLVSNFEMTHRSG